MGGATLLTVCANGDLEIAGDGWKRPNKIVRRLYGIPDRSPIPYQNHVARMGTPEKARALANELARQLVAAETTFQKATQ